MADKSKPKHTITYLLVTGKELGTDHTGAVQDVSNGCCQVHRSHSFCAILNCKNKIRNVLNF